MPVSEASPVAPAASCTSIEEPFSVKVCAAAPVFASWSVAPSAAAMHTGSKASSTRTTDPTGVELAHDGAAAWEGQPTINVVAAAPSNAEIERTRTVFTVVQGTGFAPRLPLR